MLLPVFKKQFLIMEAETFELYCIWFNKVNHYFIIFQVCLSVLAKCCYKLLAARKTFPLNRSLWKCLHNNIFIPSASSCC